MPSMHKIPILVRVIWCYELLGRDGVDYKIISVLRRTYTEKEGIAYLYVIMDIVTCVNKKRYYDPTLGSARTPIL